MTWIILSLSMLALTALAYMGSDAIVGFLRWFFSREYRPSAAKVRRIIESSLEDKIDPATFDEFSIFRIKYNSELDDIRCRFNQIVNDPKYLKAEASRRRAAKLTSSGKAELKALLDELDQLATSRGAG